MKTKQTLDVLFCGWPEPPAAKLPCPWWAIVSLVVKKLSIANESLPARLKL